MMSASTALSRTKRLATFEIQYDKTYRDYEIRTDVVYGKTRWWRDNVGADDEMYLLWESKIRHMLR